LFDKNYNGAINESELISIMQSLSLNATSTEIKDMIAEADTDNDGLIDFPEFISFLARKTISDIDLDKMFGMFTIFIIKSFSFLLSI
jgi:calmodulin